MHFTVWCKEMVALGDSRCFNSFEENIVDNVSGLVNRIREPLLPSGSSASQPVRIVHRFVAKGSVHVRQTRGEVLREISVS